MVGWVGGWKRARGLGCRCTSMPVKALARLSGLCWKGSKSWNTGGLSLLLSYLLDQRYDKRRGTQQSYLILSYKVSQSVQSLPHSYQRSRHTHSHSGLLLSFFERGGISASFCLLAGIALNGMIFRLLPFPSLSPIFLVGADLDENVMRTDLGDEPDRRSAEVTIQPHRRGGTTRIPQTSILKNQIPPSSQISKEIRTAETATMCQTQECQKPGSNPGPSTQEQGLE